MRKQNPVVKISKETTDPEWVLGRLQPVLDQLSIKDPRKVEVTLPDTRGDWEDSVHVTVTEGGLTRDYVHLYIHAKPALLHAANDGIEDGGTIRVEQFDRIILALQTARTEAKKLGLLTRRPIPKVRLA